MDVILFREVSTRLMERWIFLVIQSFDFNWDLILIKIYKPLTISRCNDFLNWFGFHQFRGLMKCLNCAHKLIEEREIFLITSHRCLFLTRQSCRLPWKISLIFQFSGRKNFLILSHWDVVWDSVTVKSLFVCFLIPLSCAGRKRSESVHECNKIN